MKNFLKNLLFVFIFVAFIGCSPSKKEGNPNLDNNFFISMDGCFLLYNLNSDSFEMIINENRCKQRFSPFSTFKIPLSVMAFDSEVLIDEKEVLKWDGIKDEREVCNRDHDARSWMQNSIVWFSQRLTPLIGEEAIKKYLKEFNYGNADVSAGITHFWLVKPGENVSALKISAYEQVEFMKNLWKDQLPVSKKAMQITRDLTYLETSPNGSKLYGKTGSGYFLSNKRIRLGWFVAYIENGDKKYIAVANFNDLVAPADNLYGGMKAKEITKKILQEYNF